MVKLSLHNFIGHNKTNFIVSNSFHLSQAILDALRAIWIEFFGLNITPNFKDFTALSKANGTSTDKLVMATKSGHSGAMIAGLKNLVSSCNACHKLYQD